MDREPEAHREVGGQKPAEPRGRIEDVAMGGPDERQPAEQVGIPLRDRPVLPVVLGGEMAETVPGNELIGVGPRQELPR